MLVNDTHISRWVEEHKRLDLDWDTMAIHRQYIRPGNTVIDAGACIGDSTISYASATYDKRWGKVLAFEPSADSFECLKRNMENFPHVKCINKALSDSRGQCGISIGDNAGGSHLRDGEGVEAVTLDSYALPFLNFLKIDVEGFEVKLLRGADKTIRRCRPVMWIEVNEGTLERIGATPQELKETILSLGYEIKNWKTVPQFDVLCLPL